MIKEDYVSFETAKLLKEKGFSENTKHEIWYVIKQFSTGCPWNSCTYKVGDITREYNDDCCIPMPTLQMAMKWLREAYTIDIVITPSMFHRKYNVCIYKDENLCCVDFDGATLSPSYEYASEAAIKYCLENLI